LTLAVEGVAGGELGPAWARNLGVVGRMAIVFEYRLVL